MKCVASSNCLKYQRIHWKRQQKRSKQDKARWYRCFISLFGESSSYCFIRGCTICGTSGDVYTKVIPIVYYSHLFSDRFAYDSTLNSISINRSNLNVFSDVNLFECIDKHACLDFIINFNQFLLGGLISHTQPCFVLNQNC